MRKLFFLIVMVVFILAFTSCDTPNDRTQLVEGATVQNLDVETLVYKSGDINIEYPRINKKLRLMDSLNREIENEAMSVLDTASKTEDVSAEIAYTLDLINERIISICYKGFVYTENQAYPQSVFYTCNIDLESGEVLTANNIFVINNDFVETIKKDARYVESKEASSQLISAVDETLLTYDPAQLMSDMMNTQKGDRVYVYFKQNIVGFSIPVLHALGDYANFEIAYDSLTPFLKTM